MSRSTFYKKARVLAFVGLAVVSAGFSGASAPRAGRDDSLSCRVQAGIVAGAAKGSRTTAFVWSSAHGPDETTGPIRTSLGQIDQETGSSASTVLTLGGKRLALPASLAGSVRFGRVIDYGGRVALAYLVERAEDSSASPSQVVVLLGAGGAVLEMDLLPGTTAAQGEHCLVAE